MNDVSSHISLNSAVQTGSSHERNRLEKLLRAQNQELLRLVRKDTPAEIGDAVQELTAQLERTEATMRRLAALHDDLAAGEDELFAILDAQKLAHEAAAAAAGGGPPATVLPSLPAGTAALHAAFMMGLKSTGTGPPESQNHAMGCSPDSGEGPARRSRSGRARACAETPADEIMPRDPA